MEHIRPLLRQNDFVILDVNNKYMDYILYYIRAHRNWSTFAKAKPVRNHQWKFEFEKGWADTV
jgi:hypothetical protein